jgi:WD40 repeat protein
MENIPLLVTVEVTSFTLVHPCAPSLASSVPLLGSLFTELGLNNIGPNAPYFMYNIQVRVVGTEVQTFDVQRRFSELAALDASLSSMTKFLPYFPPRGAQRILTNQHAQDRMKLLNGYFNILTRMEEVVISSDFLKFFGLSQYLVHGPNKVGEIHLSSILAQQLSSFAVSESFVATAMSSVPSALSQASSYLSSMVGSKSSISGTSELEVWKRLPNSHLCERRGRHSFPFRITSTAISERFSDIVFGTSDGRVGYIKAIHDNEETGFFPGTVHPGPVGVLNITGEDDMLWTGGPDGTIQKFSLIDRGLVLRMVSNAEGAAVTSMTTSDEPESKILFVGLSSGVVNVFHDNGENLRQITMLQGPSCPIVSLRNANKTLIAAHTATVMDSVEGANTVQFWEVSDILVRGTSKLAPWGPAPGPVVGASILDSSTVVVVGVNGAVNIFTHNRNEVTNRAKRIFKLPDAVDVHVCGKTMFLGLSRGVQMWELAPFSQATWESVDISSAEVCHSQPRSLPNEPGSSKVSSPSRSNLPEDDLHTWAR